MLEYLSPPLLYRTQLDPTLRECYYSQHDALQLADRTIVNLEIHDGKVYVDDICVLILKGTRAIMLATYYADYKLSNRFFLLASDGREWTMLAHDDSSVTVHATFNGDLESNRLDVYLQEREDHSSILVL